MKSFIISVIAILCCATFSYAQDDASNQSAPAQHDEADTTYMATKHHKHHRHHHRDYYDDPYYIEDPMFPTPVFEPIVDVWDVHEGVNARISMSATAGFGSGAPHGVGFGRTIDFLYVSPIKNKWNYAIGATTTGMDWGGYHHTSAGIYGNVNYYPSDKVRLSLTGYKSVLPNARGRGFNPYYSPYYDPYYDYGFGPFCDPFYGGFDPYYSSFSPYGYSPYPYRPYYNPGQLDTYVGGDLHVKLKNNSWLEVHVGASTWNR